MALRAAACAALAACAAGLTLDANDVHLFVDNEGLDAAGTVNTSIALGTVQKEYNNVAVTNEYPWEFELHFYVSAITVPADVSPTGQPYFALYYSCTYLNASSMNVCYANSSDGYTWRKPMFDLYPWTDGAPTNIVFQVNTSSPGSWPGSVLVDTAPGVPASERFKLSYEGEAGERVMYVATSADGVVFKKRSPEVPVVDVRLFSDTQTAIVYDQRRGMYSAFGRRDMSIGNNASVGCDGASSTLRRVMLAVSNVSALSNFSTPVEILTPGFPDQYSCLDIYNPAPIQVTGSSTLLLLPSSYRHLPSDQASQLYPPGYPGPGGDTSNDGLLDVRLAYSRDGLNFSFVSRDAFLPRGVGYRRPVNHSHAWSGAFNVFDSDLDAGFVFSTAGGMLDTDLLRPANFTNSFPFRIPTKRVGLLYWGGQRTHGGDSSQGFQGILRASLRRESFAAIRTPPTDPIGTASFRTLPLTVPSPASSCPGSPSAQLWLLLNLQTSVAGQVTVGLLAPTTFAALPGFEPVNAVPLLGDAIRMPVGWAPGGNASSPLLSYDLAPLAGRDVVVQVNMTHAQLWAWEVQCVVPPAGGW